MFVLDSIEKIAKEDGGRDAVIYLNSRLSFSQLFQKSGAFAEYIINNFQDSGCKLPILIYGHKEMDFLCCMYGSLMAGHAYVPVDITSPLDRVSQILENSGCQIIVDFIGLNISLDPGKYFIITPEIIEEIYAQYSGSVVDKSHYVSGDDNCYILFTSGSTGRPKGVPITCNNLENFYNQINYVCDIECDKKIAMNQISYSFDVSVMSIYIAISLGITLYTIDKETVDNPKYLYSILEESQIAMWFSTPAFAELCLINQDFNSCMMKNLKGFLLCGEILTISLANELNKRFEGAYLINAYGPTEATVLVTAAYVTEQMINSDESIPIGQALSEVTLKIVDDTGSDVLPGEKGELLIISDNVAKGYLNSVELTNEKFFNYTFDDGRVKRGYRTGDICYEKDGLYYYCGRNDFQIKLNGFRVELEDIEKNMLKIENIFRVAVCPVLDSDFRPQYLVAFVVLKEKSDAPRVKLTKEIKTKLKEFVPSYMIPRQIVFKDGFPVNVNGKTDKKALLASI